MQYDHLLIVYAVFLGMVEQLQEEELVSEEVGLAFEEVELASEEVGLAFEEVGLASEEVGLAFEEAGLASEEEVQVC